MDRRILKMATLGIVTLTLAMMVAMQFFPKIHEEYAIAREVENSVFAPQNVSDYEPNEVVEEVEQLNGKLKIELPEGVAKEQVIVKNDYISQTIQIKFPKAVEDYFSEYGMSGSSDHIVSLQYFNEDDCGVIAIGTDKVYELNTTYDESNMYLKFLSPHEVYDKVIVVDAGHGARMPGAIKNGIQEKDINLSIAMYLKEMFDGYSGNIGVYYTRTQDVDPTFQQRADLANKTDADLFISIHSNSSGTGNFTGENGTQVLYSESDDGELSSKRFAEICLSNVRDELQSKDMGLVEGDDIYIIRSSKVPIALVEVGFMSNRVELEKLVDKDYQKKAATGIFNACIQAFEEGY